MKVSRRAGTLATAALVACGGAASIAPTGVPLPTADWAEAIVDAPDRTAEDRARDEVRHPAETLTFIDVQPGMRVADLAAGAGYTTELLARAVGPDGEVYAQNDSRSLEEFVGESWPARLERSVNANVVRVDREFSRPLPPEVTDLDRVVLLFGYHDAVDRGANIASMNLAVFRALRHGGRFIIADHHAREGSGASETSQYHRIDRDFVVEQVTAAGFRLVDEAFFLRDPSDTRDWQVWSRGFRTDRFILAFERL